jgi:NAD(P)-dependent dehydrogenase (short-subunit alcohol dehydrogenase family)
MPNLETIRAGIIELPKGPPLVVAIVGGTTGIGSYVAKALATTFANHGSKLRVYIVGRNVDRAETLLKYGRETSPGSDWRFVQVSDASLISDVDRVSKEIIEQEEEAPFAGGPARLDVLYMSQALSPFQESNRKSSQAMPRLEH